MRAKGRRQQPVPSHGVENAHLSEQGHQQHADQPEDRHDGLTHQRAQASLSPCARMASAIGIRDVERVVVGNAGHDHGDRHVQRDADRQ